MQSKNPFFNDFSRLITGAVGIAQNARTELETVVSSKIESWLAERDFVNREEFEAVRIMAEKSAKLNLELSEKVSDLELQIDKLNSKGPKRPGTKKN